MFFTSILHNVEIVSFVSKREQFSNHHKDSQSDKIKNIFVTRSKKIVFGHFNSLLFNFKHINMSK